MTCAMYGMFHRPLKTCLRPEPNMWGRFQLVIYLLCSPYALSLMIQPYPTLHCEVQGHGLDETSTKPGIIARCSGPMHRHPRRANFSFWLVAPPGTFPGLGRSTGWSSRIPFHPFPSCSARSPSHPRATTSPRHCKRHCLLSCWPAGRRHPRTAH